MAGRVKANLNESRRWHILSRALLASASMMLWGAHTLHGEVATQPSVTFGLGKANALAVSADGRLLASGGGRGGVLWNIDTGQPIQVFEAGQNFVYSVMFLPGDQQLLTIGNKESVLWDIQSGERQHTFPSGNDSPAWLSPTGSHMLIRETDGLRQWNLVTGELGLQFVHDGIRCSDYAGDTVVTIGEGQHVRVWNATSGKLQRTLGSDGPLFLCTLSPDGSKVIAGAQGVLRLWDTATGALEHTFEGEKAATFSQDGKSIITRGGFARVWASEPLELHHTLEDHPERLTSVGFAPNSAFAFTTGYEQTSLWDKESGFLLHTIVGAFPVFTPDSKSFFTRSEDEVIRMWDTEFGDLIREFHGHTSGRIFGTFTPQTDAILTVDSHQLNLWSKDGNRQRSFLGHTDNIKTVSFSHRGTEIVTGSGDQTVRIWSWDAPEAEHVLWGLPGGVLDATFSPDDSLLLTLSSSGVASVWSTDPVDGLHTLQGHDARINSAIFSPDGSMILTSSHDQTAKLWDAHTGDEIRTLDGHEGVVFSAVFSPNGSQIFTGAFDGPSRLWDLNGPTEPEQLDVGAVFGAGFSRRGLKLILVPQAVLWDFESDHIVPFIIDPRIGGGPEQLSLSPDESLMLGGGSLFSNAVVLWDARTGHELRRFDAHTSSVQSVSFSQDGTQVLTTASDGLTMLWDIQDLLGRLTIQRIDGQLQLTWSRGALQSASQPNGPWGTLESAQSPHPIDADRAQLYFRVIESQP